MNTSSSLYVLFTSITVYLLFLQLKLALYKRALGCLKFHWKECLLDLSYNMVCQNKVYLQNTWPNWVPGCALCDLDTVFPMQNYAFPIQLYFIWITYAKRLHIFPYSSARDAIWYVNLFICRGWFPRGRIAVLQSCWEEDGQAPLALVPLYCENLYMSLA